MGTQFVITSSRIAILAEMFDSIWWFVWFSKALALLCLKASKFLPGRGRTPCSLGLIGVMTRQLKRLVERDCFCSPLRYSHDFLECCASHCKPIKIQLQIHSHTLAVQILFFLVFECAIVLKIFCHDQYHVSDLIKQVTERLHRSLVETNHRVKPTQMVAICIVHGGVIHSRGAVGVMSRHVPLVRSCVHARLQGQATKTTNKGLPLPLFLHNLSTSPLSTADIPTVLMWRT